MAPALGVRRGWNGGSSSLRVEAAAADTAVTQQPERLQGEAGGNKHHTTAAASSSQAVGGVLSRYPWSGEVGASSSRSPAATESGKGRQPRRSGGSGGLAAEQRRHQRRQETGVRFYLYSSFEGCVTEGEGGEEVERGGTTSPSTSATSSLTAAKLDKNATAGTAAAPKPSGGAPNQFFGSGYYGGSSRSKQQQGARKVQDQAAAAAAAPNLAAQGREHVDAKAARATDSVLEASRLRGRVGKGEGEQERKGRAPAWQQQQQQQQQQHSKATARWGPVPGGSSPGEGSVSPRKDEAPPGFEPLDTSASDSGGGSGNGMSSGRHNRPVAGGGGEAESDVQVNFPPHFDDGRKSGSGSENGSSSSTCKARGDSLGTKSGSTSLLSMMSGSPRSIGTAPDSATGGSPCTPLSDSSSAHDGGGAGVAGSRRVGGGGAQQEGGGGGGLPPAVSVGNVGNGGDGEYDDMDVPSAHPTPLSAFGGGDGELPPDHPTPKSSLGSSTGRGRSQSRAGGGDDDKGGDGRSKSIEAAPGSFMQRLKYWSGMNRQDSSTSMASAPSRHGRGSRVTVAAVQSSAAATSGAGRAAGAAVAKEATAATTAASTCPAQTASSASQSGVSPRKLPASFTRSSGRIADPRGSGGTRTSEAARPSTANSGSGGDGGDDDDASSTRSRPAAAAPLSESPPPYSETATSEASGISPAERRGVPVMPFDSVTSDAMSACNAGPPPAYRSGAGGRIGTAAAVSSTRQGPSPPYSAAVRKRQEEAARLAAVAAAAPSPAGRNDAAAEKKQEGAPARSRKFSDFGASHRAELAAMRRARGKSSPGDEEVKDEEKEVSDEEEGEGEIGWDATSDKEEEEEEKKEDFAAAFSPVTTAAAAGIKTASPRPAPRYLQTSTKPSQQTTSSSGGGGGLDVAPEEPKSLRHGGGSSSSSPRHQTSRSSPSQAAPPPPRYMAIVEAANVKSALDNSSTSEHTDTSPSEDDGGMMAEILTDRLMEVCSKMEQSAASPEADLSDGAAEAMALGGGGGVHRRRPSRRRQLSNMSNRTLHSVAGGEGEEEDADSDEGSVMDAGAAARKLRRERLRKRAKQSRKMSSVLSVPKDDRGEIIHLHTAAYNGKQDVLKAYIAQGGDLEIRDQFQATALMLCAERGHTQMVDDLLSAGAEVSCVDENANSALHLAGAGGGRGGGAQTKAVFALFAAVDSEARTPLDLATDPAIRRILRTEQMVRFSGETFDLLGAVEVNDTLAVANFIAMGQEACGYPHNPNAAAVASKRLRLDRTGRGGMSAVHLAAFHGYADSLRLLLEAGSDANAVSDDGETPLHTACNGGSILCATLLLEHGANPLATDANGLVPCEKHIAGGRQEMKQLLEAKAFQATPANLLALRADLAEVALQIDAEEDLFVRKGVAIKYLRKALKKKDVDMGRLRQAVEARDTDIRHLADRMESVHKLLKGVSALQ
ncbi:unnamed protein product [Ectocarpus fasciculatus]